MCAWQTTLTADKLDVTLLKKIMGSIRNVIPVGFAHNTDDQPWNGFDLAPDIPTIKNQISAAKKQLGTLGGGNHFIEIQKDANNLIWIMIHSGSRNFGFKIAHVYHTIAGNLCSRWHTDLPDRDLAFLPIETPEAKEYLSAMQYAVKFASANRIVMMNKVFKVLLAEIKNLELLQRIDIAHNYAAWENHFGENVLVHRKGATRAYAGELGIIPGSQGTHSYIVRGLGNPNSFKSCSHGAGRKLGRADAKRTLDLVIEQKRLDDQGIVHSVRNVSDLDEATGAYKDIDFVMTQQKDLVEIVEVLSPLGGIKG
jgi:tRNA-splicing ligase RtcB (3'-phosphate/5'-hydroxy nucleic acid ligase)